MSTETCSSCGARLSPTIEWCGQCYAPVPKAAPATPSPGPSGPPAAEVGVRVPAPPSVDSPRNQASTPKVLPPDFDLRVDQQLAALRTEAHPIPKAAVFGALALAVVMALA